MVTAHCVSQRSVAASTVQEDLSQYPPDSERQQQVIMSVADRDAFNWG